MNAGPVESQSVPDMGNSIYVDSGISYTINTPESTPILLSPKKTENPVRFALNSSEYLVNCIQTSNNS